MRAQCVQGGGGGSEKAKILRAYYVYGPQLLALIFLTYKDTHFTYTHFSVFQFSLHCFFFALNFPAHSIFWHPNFITLKFPFTDISGLEISDTGISCTEISGTRPGYALGPHWIHPLCHEIDAKE